MIPAKNNIIVEIENIGNSEYAILNPVSGSFDIMGEREYKLIQNLSKEKALDEEFYGYLLDRGYVFNNQNDQDNAINKAYEDFKKELADSQVQLMLVPTYGCNLACSYCFQHGMGNKLNLITKETVDAFFNYAGLHFSENSQKPFITLFGGEPLVDSTAQKNIIRYIVDKCAAQNYELSVVTNGYDFVSYIDILKKARIKEIQFTLDGSKEIHDSRRATVSKKGTFNRIIEGIEAAIKNKMPVNLRSVFDIENIEDMVNLADYLDEKRWLDLPADLFKTQIGRNYELFECYAKPQHLLTQVELWGKFVSLNKKYPILSKYHKPDFKGIRHIVDEGEMYMASFDTCPACKTEWVFDLYGNIYGCTASCGRSEYILGTFWPEVNLNDDVINKWKSRDVKNIPECGDCKYDVICGGGCGVIAANKNNGNILSPDCRPVKELINMGVNYYFSDIKAMAGETEIGEKDAGNALEDICCQIKKTEDCSICGSELVYSKDSSITEKCNICGKEFETYAKCINGHYVCDNCHSLNLLKKMEKFLLEGGEKNPVLLARHILEFPDLNMHGPEYHSIVPAVLVAAYYNKNLLNDVSKTKELLGVKSEMAEIKNKEIKIKEAIRRGKDIVGGSCGFYGACGAGIGAGIAVSVIENTTPISSRKRGAANIAAGRALIEIGKYEAARCCKRETITSIESFINDTDYFKDLQEVKYICNQFGKNKFCIKKKCPYFPVE